MDALIRGGGALQPGIAKAKPKIPGQHRLVCIAYGGEHLEARIFKTFEHVLEDLFDRCNAANRIERIDEFGILTIVVDEVRDICR
jgi:hypothetical protein